MQQAKIEKKADGRRAANNGMSQIQIIGAIAYKRGSDGTVIFLSHRVGTPSHVTLGRSRKFSSAVKTKLLAGGGRNAQKGVQIVPEVIRKISFEVA